MQPSPDAGDFYVVASPTPPAPRDLPTARPGARRRVVLGCTAGLLLLAVLAGLWGWRAHSASSANTAPLTSPATLGGLPMRTDAVAVENAASIRAAYAKSYPGHAIQPAFYGSTPFSVNLMLYRGDLSGIGDTRLPLTAQTNADGITCGLAFGKFADCWRTSSRFSVSVLTMDNADLQRAAGMVAEAWQAAAASTPAS